MDYYVMIEIFRKLNQGLLIFMVMKAKKYIL